MTRRLSALHPDVLKAFESVGLSWYSKIVKQAMLDRDQGMSIDEMEDEGKPFVLTWEKIIKAEPRVKSLYQLIGSVRDDPDREWFCANDLWYEYFKPIVHSLVGWGTLDYNPMLMNCRAYDIVYRKCYNRLPPCRNCACL